MVNDVTCIFHRGPVSECPLWCPCKPVTDEETAEYQTWLRNVRRLETGELNGN